jgi:flagellar hook-associated protein 3 FlgL
MNSALSLRFTTQAQMDIKRLTTELSDLQRQVASGASSNDLRGFGESAARLINTQGARVIADARGSVVDQLEARFDVQASALSQAATSTTNLAKAINDAISSSDGRNLGLELDLAFSGVTNALNETWNGQPLFAGERVGAGPIKVTSVAQLLGATTPAALFDEASRHQTIELSPGSPIDLADKASEISQGAFDSMRSLKLLIDQSGGSLGQPLTQGQIDSLQLIANGLQTASTTFNSAEGRSGQLSTRFAAERVRLQDRSDLLVKEVGGIADADLAQVSVRLNSLMVQYQASAKTFSDLSKLSLVNYL